ncbi:MAG: restriction endonuclease subunit S [Bacteroidales bacterium]|nr:restriction endonuclease subunit S [Bacteroidales bacterium]
MKEGWEYKKLGEVATYINGFAFKPEQWVSEGTPIIRIQNLNNPDAPYNYYDGEVPEKVKVVKGDLLISWSASLGAYIWDGPDAFLNQHIFKVFFDKTDIDKMYLKYAVTSKLNDMLDKVHGATMKHIVKKDFDNIPIFCPSLEDQQSIVSELDLINELIAKKKAQLKDLDSLAQSLFYEMFGDPVENEKGWEVKKLGETFKVTSSKRVMQEEWTDEGVPFYKVSDLINVISHSSTDASVYISEQKYQELLECNAVPKEFDILVTARGTIGKCYVISRNDRFYFQDGMITWLTENNGSVLPCYIVGLFNSARFIENLCSSVNQSTVAYLSIKQLSSKHVPLPPLPLQQTFASRIEAIEEEKQKIQSSLQDLETLLAARMQYWFE